ncbi:MAG TPA: Sir2 family NAD-dependent protein deacetylase [Phycisphaerae bacterium]|nr:Sir2 family NAD-dependent protein deacetylase [Phycisphaerae bacterium]
MNATPDSLRQAAAWVRNARKPVVFTGAGVSAESGIPTFRDAGGLWSKFPPEQFATWRGLMGVALRQPRRLADFIVALLEPVAAAKPNAGHRAIAELGRCKTVTVITQNVDGLHQEAGSDDVWEVHGSLLQIVDRQGRRVRCLSRDDLKAVMDAVRSAGEMSQPRRAIWSAMQPMFGVQAGKLHRPTIVLFGESMAEPDWSNALDAVRDCDCLIAVGTSGVVYPAAALPSDAQAAGAKVITIDPTQPGWGLWLRGTAAEVLPEIVKAMVDSGPSPRGGGGA